MLNPIQLKLLEMIDWFDHYCKKNNLKYYVVGGTLLGAIRHKGFIPWDDDVDIALPRPDYIRLLELFAGIEDKYLLESPYSGNEDYLYSFSKLYDTSTTLIEKTKKNCKRGIYIDIFPLDGIGNTEEESIANYKKVDKLNMFLMTRTCAIRKQRAFYKNASIVLARAIPSFIVNDKELSKKVDRISAAISFEKSEYVGNLMGAYRVREIFRKEYIGQTARYPFENIYVNGFEHFEEYLTHIYGEWRKLPPEGKRHGAHDYLEYDLNKSYMI